MAVDNDSLRLNLSLAAIAEAILRCACKWESKCSFERFEVAAFGGIHLLYPWWISV